MFSATAVNVLLASCLLVASGVVQDAGFSGKWVSGRPGDEVVVTQDDKQVTVEYFEGGKSVRRDTIIFDGRPHQRKIAIQDGEVVTTYTATWEARRLTLTTDTVYPDGQRMTGSETWSIDTKGQLVIDTKDTPAAPNSPTIVGQMILTRKK